MEWVSVQSWGMISEFVDIKDIDPISYLGNWVSLSDNSGLPTGGLTEIEFAALGELLGAGEYDQLLDAFAVEAETDDGSVLLSLPDTMTEQLSALEASGIPTVAAQWAETDELTGRTTQEAAAGFILGLKAFISESEKPRLLLSV